MGYRDPSLPEVKFSELADGSGFKDQAFRVDLARWMKEWMPSMPLDLLDTDDVEKWEVEYPPTYSLEEVSYLVWVCSECGDEHLERPDVCCSVEGVDELATPAELTEAVREGYGIWDDEYGRWVESARRDGSDYDAPHAIWLDEDDAEQRRAELDQERQDEGSYGFPWANNRFYMPDPYIPADALHDAGFVVATYNGYRLCGIDGGGYAFDVAHHAKLYAFMSERRDIAVETSQGRAYVTTDERTPAEKLAAVDLNSEESA